MYHNTTAENTDDLWEIVTCQICLCRYDTMKKKPVNMNCGHTICFDCAEKISVSTQFPLLTCPFDRETFYTSVKSLKVNFIALKLVEKLNEQHTADLKKTNEVNAAAAAAQVVQSNIQFNLKRKTNRQKFALFFEKNENNKLVIGKIRANSNAYRDGLRKNDLVLEVSCLPKSLSLK